MNHGLNGVAHMSNLKFGHTPMHARGVRHSGGLWVVDDPAKVVAKTRALSARLPMTNTTNARGARAFLAWEQGAQKREDKTNFQG